MNRPLPPVPPPVDWAVELVNGLTAAGVLDDLAWRDAFATIPRHHFLPHVYTATGDTWRRLDPHSAQGDWLRLAYRDHTWVLRLTGPHHQPGQPASSSIQPSLAARMLHELSVTDNSHVLEIGTGTGYLTALLCHRLGPDHITSIDIDPELVDLARTLLAQLGYSPTLATADGTDGYPDYAPYDRVLGTATVPSIPQPWLHQTRPGGRIVTPLRSAIAVLDVHDNEHATGRFLPTPARVLPLRPHTPTAHPQPDTPRDAPTAERPIPVHALYDDNFRFLLDLALPGIDYDDPLGALTVRHPDGSSAQISPGGRTQQHGPRRLGDEIAALHRLWHTTGSPGPDRYRLTIDAQHQTIRLDDPHSPEHWNL